MGKNENKVYTFTEQQFTDLGVMLIEHQAILQKTQETRGMSFFIKKKILANKDKVDEMIKLIESMCD